MENIKEFIKLVGDAQRIIDSPIEWETKFDLIFSDIISKKISELGILFEWCDPDTSYEDDVLAYYNAVKSKAEELEKIFDKDAC